jgi:hypothetical protein
VLNQSVQGAFNQGVQPQLVPIPQPVPQSTAGQIVAPASYPATGAAMPQAYRNPVAWGNNSVLYWDTNTASWQTNRTGWRIGLPVSPNLPPGP